MGTFIKNKNTEIFTNRNENLKYREIFRVQVRFFYSKSLQYGIVINY